MSHDEINDEIEDQRKHPFFSTDNIIIDRYLRQIGCHAFTTYSVLSRFAGQKDAAFPGIKKIMEVSGQSRSGVHKCLKILVTAGLIRIVRRFRDHGGSTSNTYILLDLSEPKNDNAQKPVYQVDSVHQVDEGVHQVDGGASTVWTRGGTPGVPHIKKTQSYKDSSEEDIFKKTTTNTAPPQVEANAADSVVVSSKTKKAPEPLPPPVPPPDDVRAKLEAQGIKVGIPSQGVIALVGMGVSPSTAERIVSRRGEFLALEWVAAVKGGHCDTSKRGAGAFLVSALGGDGEAWELPPAYTASKRDRQARERAAAEDARREQLRRQAKQIEQQAKAERERRWENLSEEEREKIAAQARADLLNKPNGKRLAEGPIGEVWVRDRCLELLPEEKAA